MGCKRNELGKKKNESAVKEMNKVKKRLTGL